MHIYVVNQVGGDEPEIWDRAYKSFAEALDAVEEYITKLNKTKGYEDEIEKETGREGSENSGGRSCGCPYPRGHARTYLHSQG